MADFNTEPTSAVDNEPFGSREARAHVPLSHENETIRTPYATYALIALNVAAWLLAQGAGGTLPLARSVCELGLIPGELTGSLRPGTPFSMGEGLVCLTDPDGRRRTC